MSLSPAQLQQVAAFKPLFEETHGVLLIGELFEPCAQERYEHVHEIRAHSFSVVQDHPSRGEENI